MIEVENLQQTLDRFIKLGTPIKNLIPWHVNGQSQPLVTQDEHGKIVCIDGFEFHCHDDKDEKTAKQIIEQYRIMKMYYKIPPEKYPDVISQFLFNMTRIKMDWNNPRTFQEKIQWLKLYDSTPLKTICADKFKVREYVSRKIGSQYLIPLLDVWNDPDEIDLDELPDQFVLKCNHGSGFNIIVRDKNKFDFEAAKEKLRGWLKIDYGMFAFEFHYCAMKPKIVAEKFIEVDGEFDIPNYKFYCFNGEPKFIQYEIGHDTELCLDFFDLDWTHLSVRRTDHPQTTNPENIRKPHNLKLMIELSRKMSEDFAFVRVDFYEVGDQIFFGELTFSPSGGAVYFIPSEYNEKFGDMLQLPQARKIFNRFEKY